MASSNDLKLLGLQSSPYVLRARIALNIKALEYEYLQEPVPRKSELLLSSNPVYKKIPVLIHNNNSICESLIIVEYVDEVWTSGPSILPTDPYDRAVARFWATYIDDKWFLSMKSILMAEGDEQAKKPHIEQMEEVVVKMEDAFNKCSRGKDFFGGDEIGYLDIAFGSFLGWQSAIEQMNGLKLMDEAKTPSLAKWAERFAAHDVVKGLTPEVESLIEVAKILPSIWRSLK